MFVQNFQSTRYLLKYDLGVSFGTNAMAETVVVKGSMEWGGIHNGVGIFMKKNRLGAIGPWSCQKIYDVEPLVFDINTVHTIKSALGRVSIEVL